MADRFTPRNLTREDRLPVSSPHELAMRENLRKERVSIAERRRWIERLLTAPSPLPDHEDN